MAYKGSPTLLCHLVLLDTLLIGEYTLRSMGVNAFFLRLNMNGILLGSSDLILSCKISYMLWSYKTGIMDRSKGCRFYDETFKDFKDNSAIIFFPKDNDCESRNKHIDIK